MILYSQEFVSVIYLIFVSCVFCRLCVAFLAFDVMFVVICVAVASLIGIAVCCCLPCIIAILYALADQVKKHYDDEEQMSLMFLGESY